MSEVPQCYICSHYKNGHECEAFTPDPIPDAILFNEFDHGNPYPGDHGILRDPVVPDYEFELTEDGGAIS
jgi:hypothetical protein